ncbi:hypothetical protein DL765_010349 [Monosporascus sp. GIB2]|nr:hypothetical protein DL765_010349 [Monosporascus sp. GIB2]
MDPSQNGTEDTRSQPWKEWAEKELEARRKAEETEEGRKEQEAREQAYLRNGKDDGQAYESPGNKAG